MAQNNKIFINLPLSGSQGIDFDANLAIDTIDFGTFHVCLFLYLIRSGMTEIKTKPAIPRMLSSSTSCYDHTITHKSSVLT
jgi:hypothetical protein